MTMKWTQHAQDVFSKRKIPASWIDRAIAAPELTYRDEIDPGLTHYLKTIPEFGNRVLRVIMNTEADPQRLVTFYFDRKMKGKL